MKLKRSGMLTKILLLILLIAGIITLLNLQGVLKDREAQRAALQLQVDRKAQENASLIAAIEGKDELENIKNFARDTLGLMDPGEIDFYDSGN